jgi:hypothetical protein
VRSTRITTTSRTPAACRRHAAHVLLPTRGLDCSAVGSYWILPFHPNVVVLPQPQRPPSLSSSSPSLGQPHSCSFALPLSFVNTSAQSRSVAPSALQVLLLVFFFICYGIQPLHATKHHHQHHQWQALPKRNGSVFANGSMSLEEARDIVARFQKAMASANARILSNPRPNVHSVLNGSELVKIPQKAPPLDYQGSNSPLSELMRRIRRQMSLNQTVPANSSLAYSVPLEVVQAAQMVAEASPPSNSADD